MSIETIYRFRFHILAVLFVGTLLATWPGYLNPDSMNQYLQATTAQFTDHHPPLMSFFWHYLDQIHKGSGLMYTLQLLFFYGAIAILLLVLDKLITSKQRWLSIFLILVPIYPQVLIYAMTVVKDVQYAFCFLFASALLAYYTVTHRKLTVLATIGLFIILIYGAGVKYQGKFCVIIPSLWLGCLLIRSRKLWKKLILGVLIFVIINAAISTINELLVPQKFKSLSWQCVKLYDLAAMSLTINQDLIPQYNRTAFYTFEELQKKFDYPSIDSCIYAKRSILRIARDEARMNILYKTWLLNVFKHPIAYMQHRMYNMSYTLLSRPGFIYAEPIINKLHPNTALYAVAYETTSLLFYAFMSHLPIIILGACYFAIAIIGWHYSKAAPVLLGVTATGLLMTLILFFMSMAGSPRYTYISIVMINVMHAFAYVCYKDSKKHKA